MEQNPQPLMVTARQVRQLLSLSKASFYRLVKQKVFVPHPATRSNRLYPFSQVLAFVAQASQQNSK